MNKFKHFFAKIGLYLKNNSILYAGILISNFIFIYSSSLIAIPFDGQIENEVTEVITKNAEESEFELSLNSVELSPTGNSDFYIYSSNALQDFQMLNQQYNDIRSYAFAAYKPEGGRVSFKYEGLDCTSILFESKFQDNKFYFDLPLLFGSIRRFTDKNSIYLIDTFAEKIKGTSNVENLIKRKITGQTINCEASDVTYTIEGIFDTNNKLGRFLKNVFGENIIFVPEYTSFQMKGALYFVGSTNKVENTKLVDFIYNNYKKSSGSSRGLAIGYSITNKFYDYNPNTETHELGMTNTNLNKIIDGYNSNSTIIGILGIMLFTGSLILTLLSCIKSRDKLSSYGKGVYLFSLWSISCFSLLINSIIYSFLPLMSLIAGTSFLTKSTFVSTVIFLSWIFITGLLSFIPFGKQKLLYSENR